MGADAGLPRWDGCGLQRLHCINMFRSPLGIHAKWKQYMTDDAWSRPVLLIGHRQMLALAKVSPAPRAMKFEHEGSMMQWVNKLEQTLQGGNSQQQSGIAWLRTIIAHADPRYSTSMGVEDIANELISIDLAEAPRPNFEEVKANQLVHNVEASRKYSTRVSSS